MWSDPMGAIDFCLLCLLNFNVNCLWNSGIATAMCYLTSIYRLSKCLLYVDTPPPVCCDVTSRMANKKQRRCVRAKWSSLNVRINNEKKNRRKERKREIHWQQATLSGAENSMYAKHFLTGFYFAVHSNCKMCVHVKIVETKCFAIRQCCYFTCFRCEWVNWQQIKILVSSTAAFSFWFFWE